MKKYSIRCIHTFRCQHREQLIFKWNYENTVVQEIHISIFVTWYWSIANFLRDYIIQISISQMNFPSGYVFSQLWKAEIFVETFTPFSQILIFKEQDSYIWYWLGPNYCNSAYRKKWQTNLFFYIDYVSFERFLGWALGSKVSSVLACHDNSLGSNPEISLTNYKWVV